MPPSSAGSKEGAGGGETGEGSVHGKRKEKGEGGPKFEIVSTGAVWEELLGRVVRDFLGGGSERFAGVETTGLTAVELHERPEEEVWGMVREAAGRLVRRGDVPVVCLGCAGMVGMEAIVREGVRGVLGDDGRVRAVDGVKAGVGMLVGLVMGGRGVVWIEGKRTWRLGRLRRLGYCIVLDGVTLGFGEECEVTLTLESYLWEGSVSYACYACGSR